MYYRGTKTERDHNTASHVAATTVASSGCCKRSAALFQQLAHWLGHVHHQLRAPRPPANDALKSWVSKTISVLNFLRVCPEAASAND